MGGLGLSRERREGRREVENFGLLVKVKRRPEKDPATVSGGRSAYSSEPVNRPEVG